MRIAVAGDGIAAHLACAMLARVADVVRVPVGAGGHGLGPVGHVVTGAPAWMATDLAARVGHVPGAVATLGIAFAGWSPQQWFLPYGDVGAPLETIPFPQLIARLRSEGHGVEPGDFSLATLAARAGRLPPPDDDPRSPWSTVRPGITYPCAALATRLAALADVPVTAPLAAPPGDAPRIAALALADGTTLSADLYVDAGGGAAGIATSEWESWARWLPCTGVTSRIVASDAPPPPFPLHSATPDGWRATVALEGAIVDTAYGAGGERYDNGLRRTAWRGNRVAIGAAAGVVEPVLGHALLLAHDAVARLIGLLPAAGSDGTVEAAEYHRLTARQHERARDAAVALWATRRGSEDVPPALAHKLALYRSRGHVPMDDDDPLSRGDWAMLLDGQGERQRRVDPIAAALPGTAVMDHCRRLRAIMLRSISGDDR
ncbi:hypothetical protein ASG29_13370 [Sphingomonas sp. Leaf412]|uniref:tryptophan 7-halogenase n=1 Tax=Sphingomonas sp. Leaf412 TaxID=1736370 RepID=UPI0006F2829B|nr:tryptophan 7-halogenase [Sphingomonas sp. Leaf412]KQT32714.1 hypothetical protein ASG29_13370 [Sphingomonas sp. Leaf412]